MTSLKGMARSAFVTGGTGSIGEAIVRRLAAAGVATVFQYHSNLKLAEQLSADSGASAHFLDLADLNSLRAMSTSEYDILINCAGINLSSELLASVSFEDWERTLAINLTAPFLLCQWVLPHMTAQRWGRIVNVGSIYSFKGSLRNTPYSASKHGLSALSRTIALEYGEVGITANDVLPGAVESRMMVRLAARKGGVDGPDHYLDGIRESYPDKRLALPSEVASAVEYLIGEDAGHTNGTAIVVDGGLTA